MSTRPQIKIRYGKSDSYPSLAQGNYVGAQTVAGQRGSLPAFTTGGGGNSYYIDKLGADANAGTSPGAGNAKLTLGSLYSTTASLLTDASGVTGVMTQVGTVPSSTYPHWPTPAHGNVCAGQFTDANYLVPNAALKTALQGKTAFTIEGWFFVDGFPNANAEIFYFHDNTAATDTAITITSTGVIQFIVNNIAVSSAAAAVVAGNWYYFMCSFTSDGVNARKQIWLGLTPETCIKVASAVQAYTVGAAVSTIALGRNLTAANRYLAGYLNRIAVLTVDRTVSATVGPTAGFPVAYNAASMQALYEFQTRPLMHPASTPKTYIVIGDSGTYNEGLYANFRYDITAAVGIYAKDGFAPTFKQQKGAVTGTYGAGNSAQTYTASTTASTCYVSKAGNDGTGARGGGGTPGNLPFLTIQAALNATTTDGDTIEIRDSGIYKQDLTMPARNLTIQAYTGKIPVIQTDGTITGVTDKDMILGAAANKSYTFIGIVLDGSSKCIIFDSNVGQSSIIAVNCTFKNALRATVGIENSTCSYTNCIFTGLSVSTRLLPTSTCAAYGGTFTNCYFNVNNYGAQNLVPESGASYTAGPAGITLGVSGASFKMTNCTVNNYVCCFSQGNGAAAAYMSVTNCLFINSMVNVAASGVIGSRSYVAFIGCVGVNARINMTSDQANSTYFYNLINNSFTSGAAASTYHVNQASTGVVRCAMRNCIGSYAGRNFYYSGSQTTPFAQNCSSLAATVYGMDGPAALLADSFADYGSATFTTGVTVLNAEASAGFLSSTAGAENFTLKDSDAANFTGSLTFRDIGYDYANFDFLSPSVTLNGLIFGGAANQEAGVGSTSDKALTIAYCTFTGMGFYGLKAPNGSSVTNCVFANINGVGCKTAGDQVTFSNNIGYGNAGALIVNYGQSQTITANSSYNGTYGQYDAVGSSLLSCVNNVYNGATIYDYSGEASLDYCCIGTLDPARGNTVGTHSIRSDPLYRSPGTGDLRLSAIAAGQLFNSPAIAISATSTDLGAFIFTYGVATTSWATTLDFNANDGTGPVTGNWTNPSHIQRDYIAIKLSEADKDGGALYSAAAAFKLQYTMTWLETNATPTAQLAALKLLFAAASNVIQVQFDGSTWIDAFLSRAQGFSYQEDPALGYVDTTNPTPLNTLVIREA